MSTSPLLYRTFKSTTLLFLNIFNAPFTSALDEDTYYEYVNSPPPTLVTSLRGGGFVRRLVFKFPPEKSGNPYSYRRVHFATTV